MMVMIVAHRKVADVGATIGQLATIKTMDRSATGLLGKTIIYSATTIFWNILTEPFKTKGSEILVAP